VIPKRGDNLVFELGEVAAENSCDEERAIRSGLLRAAWSVVGAPGMESSWICL
jgi:hypothetical protein